MRDSDAAMSNPSWLGGIRIVLSVVEKILEIWLRYFAILELSRHCAA
jgi:hypothetical protein